jgi:hypothetical protein
MMTCKQQPPISYAVAELEAVSASAGLTQDDLKRLFASGLGVYDLLGYVEAVIADRLS